jgi:NarL family two-component system response regulator YdfI
MIRVLVKASSSTMQRNLVQMVASDAAMHLVRDDQEQAAARQVPDDDSPDVIIVELEEWNEETPWEEWRDENGPTSALLILVDDPESFPGADAFRAGVRGILRKQATQEELVAAVRAAAAGLIVLHPEDIPAAVPGRLPANGRAEVLLAPLTPREQEVLHILAEGGSNKDIASRLSISEHTAKFHVSSIMSKLGASSRTEAVTLAIRKAMIML